MAIDKTEIPKNLPQTIENFLHKYREIFDEFETDILYRNKAYPTVKVKLEDVMVHSEELLDYILKEPNKAMEDFQEVLLNSIKNKKDYVKALREHRVLFKKAHIIPDITNMDNLVPIYEHFTKGTIHLKDKLVLVKGLWSSFNFMRETVATMIEYQCLSCGLKFPFTQFRMLKGKYRSPTSCYGPRCKAKGKNDFKIVRELKTHEVGKFRIHERNVTNLEIDAYTFVNYDYFGEKAKTINMNDEIEIIGIIRNDYSELTSSKDNQEIREYIEVLDFAPKQSKATDKGIVEQLRKSFENNPDYLFEILDSIHPYTRKLYPSRLLKLVILIGIGTSDSWDTAVTGRNSINAIVGSTGGQYKSSILKAFRDIMGASLIGIISGQTTNEKGLVPTTQRNNDSSDLIVRQGALASYHRCYLGMDEGQYAIRKKHVLNPIKNLEDGEMAITKDGMTFITQIKLSFQLFMNWAFNEDEYEDYDYDMTFVENVKYIENSELERFDIAYAIPEIPEDLSPLMDKRMFEKNNSVISRDYVYNYIKEFRRLISETIEVSPEMQLAIRGMMSEIRKLREYKRPRNSRETKTLVKLVVAVAGMRLKKKVDLDDLLFVKKYFVHMMIPFFDSDKIRMNRPIDLKEIYRNIFELLAEIMNSIPVKLHISLMIQHLKDFYFPRIKDRVDKTQLLDLRKLLDRLVKTQEKLDKNDINGVFCKIFGYKDNLQNTQYRMLFEGKDNRDFIDKMGYIVGKNNNSTHYIRKSWLEATFLRRIKTIFKTNDNIPLDRKGLTQLLDIDFSYEQNTYDLIVDSLIERNQLKQVDKMLLIQ
jgi:DNA replicative helicase MCM subunit Mcm2 (Cdc46/Mcm family)